jgi:protoporphyrin/coproporphyrin ferrochelatase
MPRYVNSPQYEHDQMPRIGVLIVNTGTPDEPTPRAVRRFLAQMLADPRLIELPRALWLPILHGVVLRVRPRRSARAYRKIWTNEGSPQLTNARRAAQELHAALEHVIVGLTAVELGMTYGNPSIPSALARLRESGAQRLIALPLFPQYAAVTTGSIFDAVTRELQRWRWVPETRFVTEYHDEPGYIAALAASVRERWQTQGRGERLVMSFHSMPKKYFEQGDPYFCKCQKTSRLLAEALNLRESEWSLAFQSRFGFQEWLRPYVNEVVTDLAGRGVKRVDVICPGFAMDCLESLEEIGIRAAERFRLAGGERLEYIPALNAREDHIACLARLIARHCGGWIEASLEWAATDHESRQQGRQARAIAAGAAR